MICKKCGISEMECDCPQWSPEALAIIKEQNGCAMGKLSEDAGWEITRAMLEAGCDELFGITYMTNPVETELIVVPTGTTASGCLTLGLPARLFGFPRGCRRDLAHGLPERVLVAVRAKLTSGVDELLALASAVVGYLFGLCHAVSLADLRAPSEVRHG
jgi:hypothetical protein